jgi:hypothetical protein
LALVGALANNGLQDLENGLKHFSIHGIGIIEISHGVNVAIVNSAQDIVAADKINVVGTEH